MSCTAIAAINPLDGCEGNAGGLVKVYLVNAENIDTIPAATAQVISGNITMVGLNVFVGWSFTPGTAKFTETSEGDIESRSYKQEISLFIPKDRSAVAAEIQKVTNARLVAIYQDANGKVKLVGTPDNPLYVNSVLDSGAGSTDKNGHTITLSVAPNTATKAPFYTGTLPI